MKYLTTIFMTALLFACSSPDRQTRGTESTSTRQDRESETFDHDYLLQNGDSIEIPEFEITLELSDTIISGQSFDPTNSIKEWADFSLNIKTKELTGGSYREFTKNNSDVPKVVLENENKIKPWWKVW